MSAAAAVVVDYQRLVSVWVEYVVVEAFVFRGGFDVGMGLLGLVAAREGSLVCFGVLVLLRLAVVRYARGGWLCCLVACMGG